MKNKTTLPVWLFLLVLLSGACSQEEPSTKQSTSPNVILIMADDHAQKAISAYTDELVQTPYIDRIAEEGALFENSFVTNSICAPSRAVMLTGKYSHLNGLRDNLDSFNTDQMIFPKLLQKAGYYTALVGKWHLKNLPKGFDYWNILPGQGSYYNPEMIRMGDTLSMEGYTTTLITDEALKVLNDRPRDQPFCLLYHHKAPHRNWMPDTSHLSLFEDRTFPLPETFYDDYATRTEAASMSDMEIRDMYLSLDMKLLPEYFGEETGTGGLKAHNPVGNWVALYNNLTPEQKAAWDAHYMPINRFFKERQLSGKALDEWKFQRYMKDYLRCIVSVDENIGRVLDYLDENGLTENTVVIYTSDQGFYLGEHGWYDKRYMYEQSLRTPLVVRYPKVIQPGQRIEEMVLNLDLAPTVLDFAGLEVPAEMQGRSMRPLVEGEEDPEWRDAIYYHYYQATAWHNVPRHYGVRTDRYKLIHFYELDDAWELYDLKTDPQEVNNLYGQQKMAEVQQQLKQELGKLRAMYQIEENQPGG